MRTPLQSDPFVSAARLKMRGLAEGRPAEGRSAEARSVSAKAASSAGKDAIASLVSRFESAEVKEARRRRHEEETARLFELEAHRREAEDAERKLREEEAALERLRREEAERRRLAEEAAKLEEELREEEARLRAEQRMATRRQQMAEDERRLADLKPALAAFERAKMARKPAELRHEAPKSKAALANKCAVQDTRDRLLRKMRADEDARRFEKQLERLAHEHEDDCAMTKEQSPEDAVEEEPLAETKESAFERKRRSLMQGLLNAKGQSLAALTGGRTRAEGRPKAAARKPRAALPSMFEQQEKRDAEFRRQKTEQKENIPVDKQTFTRSLDKFEDVDARREAKTQLQRLTSDQKAKKATWAQRKEEEKRKVLEEQELRRRRELEEEKRRKDEEEERIRRAKEDEERRIREAEAEAEAEAERVRVEEEEQRKKQEEQRRKKKELKLRTTAAPKQLPKLTSPACSQMRLRLQAEAEKRGAGRAQTASVGKLDISSFGSVRQLLEGPTSPPAASPPDRTGSAGYQRQISVLKENPLTDIKRRFSRRARPEDGESGGCAVSAAASRPAKPSPTDSKTRAQEQQVQQKAEAEAEAISSAATSGAVSACPEDGDDDADGQAAVTATERAADLTSQQHEQNEDTHKEQGANQHQNKDKDTKRRPAVKRQKPASAKKDTTMASKTSMQNYLISHLLFDEDTSKTRSKKQTAAPSLKLKTNEVGDIKSRFERQQGQTGPGRASAAPVPAQDPATFDEKVSRVKVLFGEKAPEASLASGMPVRSKVALNRDLLGKFDSPEMAAQLKAAKERETRERQRMVERAEERKKKESEAVQRLREQREQEEEMEKLKRQRQIKREMEEEDEKAMFEEVEAALEEAMTAGKANEILREMEDLMDDAADSLQALKPTQAQAQAQVRPLKMAPKQKMEPKPSLRASSSDIKVRGDALKKKFESSLLGETATERQTTRPAPKPSPSIKSMAQDLFRPETEVKKDFQDTRSLGGVGEVLNKTKQRFETVRVEAAPPNPQPKKEWSWKKKAPPQAQVSKPKEEADAPKKKEAEALYLTEKWRRKKRHIEDLQTFLSRNRSLIPDDAGVHRWVDGLGRSNTDQIKDLVAKQTEEQRSFLDDVNAFLERRDADSASNAFKETVRVYMDLIENEEKGRISEAKKLSELKTEKVSNMKKAMMEQQQKQQQLSTRKKSPTLERKSRLDSILATASQAREQSEAKTRPTLKKQTAVETDRAVTSDNRLQNNIRRYEARSKPRPHSSYHYRSGASDDEEDDIPLHVLKDEQLYEMYKERFYSVDDDNDDDSDADEEAVGRRAPETPARQDSYTALKNIMGLMRQKQSGQTFKTVQQTFDGTQPAEEPRPNLKPVKTGGDKTVLKSAKSVFEKAASVAKPEPPPRKTMPRSLSYNTASIKSKESAAPWRQKSVDPSGAAAQARKMEVTKPSFRIPDEERSSESREALRRKFENRGQNNKNSSLGHRRLSSDISDLPYSVGKSSSFSKFRDSFETGSITDLRKESHERRTLAPLSKSSSFDVFKKAFEANRGSEIRHEDETEDEYLERMERQRGSREHLYPLSRNSSFDMFRKAFESNKANCLNLNSDSDSDTSSYDGRRRLSRPDIPISRSSSFDMFRKAFDTNRGNRLRHDDDDNVSLVDDDEGGFRPGGGLALSKSASMVRFEEDMREQYAAARGAGKGNALRRNNSFTKFKTAFEANTGGLRGDDSDSDLDDFDDDDDVDGRSGRGSNYDLRRNDSFSKFRDAFENSRVSQLRDEEEPFEAEEERPYGLSRSNSRAEVQAELNEIRSSSRLKKLMHTLKPSKTSSAAGNPFADSSFAAAASSAADEHERNAPSLLKKSFTTTSISFDKETCREISKSREAIKSFMDSSASKVSFGSGVKRASAGDNADPKKPKESKAAKLAEARAKKFPQFADRKWVFDTINKYFDVIEENVEEEKEEERDESFDATPSPSPSPSVTRSPSAVAPSLKMSMQSQSLLKPPSATPTSSPRLSPASSFSSSTARVISSFASAQPSTEVKSLLSEIMNENTHLNLDMFKKNLSAQLVAFSSRKQ